MLRRKGMSDLQVDGLKLKPKAYTVPDPGLLGHYVRVRPTGAKTFVAVARNPFGKQLWVTIAATNQIKIEQAREQARSIITRVKAGQPAIEPPQLPPDSFEQVARNWIKRHVDAKRLRTRDELVRVLERYILPHWGVRPFTDIRRSDVAALLDGIQDNHGAAQADKALTVIRSICNWHATRDDNYVVPIVKGMKRDTAGARKRILSDDELRIIWKAAEANGPFGSLVQLALLTAQRRDKLLGMRWADISADGTWTVPNGSEREKGSGGELQLPELAQDILRRQPHILGSDLVFPPRSGVRMSPTRKADFEAKLPKMERWTIHDCRRTARSLMSRAGVNSEHAERVLGHVIPGVEGIYDRHAYTDEKRIALEKLAALITDIVHGAPDKVVRIKARG
jgi:integrase